VSSAPGTRRGSNGAAPGSGDSSAHNALLSTQVFRAFVAVAAMSALLAGGVGVWLGTQRETRRSEERLQADAEGLALLVEGLVGRHPGVERAPPKGADRRAQLDGATLQHELDLSGLALLDRLVPARSLRDRDALIVDREGRKLTGSPVGEVLEVLPGWPWHASDLAPGKPVHLELPAEDGSRDPYVVAIVPVGGTDWQVVVRRPRRVMIVDALRQQLGGVLVAMAALAFFAVVARRVAGRVSTAVAARLDRADEEQASGQLARGELESNLRTLAGTLERQVAERTAELASSEARYRELVEDSLGMMCKHDLRGNLLMVNAGASEALGYAPEELIGRNLGDLMAHAGEGWLAAYLAELQGDGRRSEGLMKVFTREGKERIWHYRNRLVDEPGKPPYVLGHAVDVTERHAAEREARRLALHDPLTGLANRLLMLEQLEIAIHRARRAGRRVAVVYLDLDGFKAVNDQFGHATGDVVLREAAGRLRRHVRRSDLLARIGGDEIVAVVADLQGRAVVATVVETMVVALAEPWPNGVGTTLSASAGVALWPDDGDSPEVLLAGADRALYEAKRAGKRRWAWASPEPETETEAGAETLHEPGKEPPAPPRGRKRDSRGRPSA
jgi:diguanylate cyclase (GGDEF)-like protein/PAS domain S-box-containing protein